MMSNKVFVINLIFIILFYVFNDFFVFFMIFLCFLWFFCVYLWFLCNFCFIFIWLFHDFLWCSWFFMIFCDFCCLTRWVVSGWLPFGTPPSRSLGTNVFHMHKCRKLFDVGLPSSADLYLLKMFSLQTRKKFLFSCPCGIHIGPSKNR